MSENYQKLQRCNCFHILPVSPPYELFFLHLTEVVMLRRVDKRKRPQNRPLFIQIFSRVMRLVIIAVTVKFEATIGPMYKVKLLITGKVQGVFYRQSMKSEANALGLFGWVRNLDSGAVEAEVFGDESKIQALLEWCQKGPDRAIVEEVQKVDHQELAADHLFEFENFSVR